MKNALVSVALISACTLATAKLPPLDDAAKAKAAEAAARSGWQAKVDAFQLCRSQDRVVSHYRKTAATAPAGTARIPSAVAAGTSAAPPTVAAVPASAQPGAAVSPAAPGMAASGVPAATSAATAAPVAPATSTAGAPPSTPCAEPGPFAYTPPEQKPLEVSGAHSPTGTAVSPPSTNTPAAAIAPAKK